MSRELIRDLRALRLDFVLARIPPETDAVRVRRGPGQQRAHRPGGRRWPPARSRRSVGLADLLDFNWVMQSSGAPIRMAIEDALLGMGARLPRRITNTSSLLVTIAMLDASDTVAPVSREVASLLIGVGARPADPRSCRWRERIVVAPYMLLSTRGRRLSPIAQRCRDMVAEMLDGASEAKAS